MTKLPACLAVVFASGVWAADPAAPQKRGSSEDAAFSIAYDGEWVPLPGTRGRCVELGKKTDRLLVAGEWRDGSTPPPTEAHRGRLRGAETALLSRRGPLGIHFERRPARGRTHLQGWLSCGGDRYLFDGLADTDKELWRLLESFRCRERRANGGLPITGTGWRVEIPAGFEPAVPLQDAVGTWKRQLGRGGENHEQFLTVARGTEIWDRTRPWPDACGKPPEGFIESSARELRYGKTALRYVCGRLSRNYQNGAMTGLVDQGDRTLVYLLVYDYDSAIGQGGFIKVELREWPAKGPPDTPMFARIVNSLERTSPENPARPEAPAGGAVPLLR